MLFCIERGVRTLEKVLDLSNINLENAPELILKKVDDLTFLSKYIESAAAYKDHLIIVMKISIIVGILLVALTMLFKIITHKKAKLMFCISFGVIIGSCLGFNAQINTVADNKAEAERLYEQDFVEFGNLYYEWTGKNIFE